jgi:cytochrome c5
MRCLRHPAGGYFDNTIRSGTLEYDGKKSSLLDGSTITIIVIAIVVVAWATFASNLHDFTQSRSLDRVEFHATVEERIRPFARVMLPGEEHSADELKVDEVPMAEPHATTLSGPQVFNQACIACHGSGIGGAPTLDDAAAWAPRIEQGMETLYLHSVEGYTGSAGYMPPKGARLDLSDDEVKSAVDYMLSQLPE